MKLIKINNQGSANILEIIVLTTFVSVMFLTALFVWHEIEIAKLQQPVTPEPVVSQDIEVTDILLADKLADPRYCVKDDDCVAAINKNNKCYQDFFNKNASSSIKEYEDSMAGLVLPGCPQYGEPVCVADRCTDTSAQ